MVVFGGFGGAGRGNQTTGIQQQLILEKVLLRLKNVEQ